MDGTAFIQQFREETVDEVEPYLWSDTLILRYLDEAQVEFCRRTEGLEDSITLTVHPDIGVVALSPQIRKIRAATLGGRPLKLCTVESARAGGVPPTPAARGVPTALVLGLTPNAVQIVPPPAVECEVQLDVFRLPLRRLTSPSQSLEVDARHAPTLMQYALSRAYSRPDPDTMDRTRAEYFSQLFELECARARREQGRTRSAAGTTTFSW